MDGCIEGLPETELLFDFESDDSIYAIPTPEERELAEFVVRELSRYAEGGAFITGYLNGAGAMTIDGDFDMVRVAKAIMTRYVKAEST